MEDRYTNLFKLNNNLYFANAPIIIEAGALLKDNKENRLIVQLKLLNISFKTIVAVKIDIDGADAFGNKTESQEFQYLDINVTRNQEFGQQTPIILINNYIRCFNVNIIEVVFSDGCKWINENNTIQLLEIESLSSFFNDKGLLQQYLTDNGKQCNTVPKDFNDLWICSCGTFNHCSENVCNLCKKNKEDVLLPIDIEKLKKERQDFLKEEKYIFASEYLNTSSIEKIKKAKTIFNSIENYKDSKNKIIECDSIIQEINDKNNALLEKQRANNKKKVIFTALSLVATFIIIMSVVSIKIFIPNYNYNLAIQKFENGQFDEAIKRFENLGDYKETKNYINKLDSIEWLNKIDINNIENDIFSDDIFLEKYLENIGVLEGIDNTEIKNINVRLLDKTNNSCINKYKNGEYILFSKVASKLIEHDYANDMLKETWKEYKNKFDYSGEYKISYNENEYVDKIKKINVDYEAGKITIDSFEFELNDENVYTSEFSKDGLDLKVTYALKSDLLTVAYGYLTKRENTGYSLVDLIYDMMYQYKKTNST